MNGISLVIAGSRGVAPTNEQITAEVIRLPLAWPVPLPDDPAGMAAAVLEREALIRQAIREVVCGKAKGADMAGQAWAIHHDIPVHYEAITTEDVRKYGKYMAPKMRNRRMAERGDMGICFWDGMSGGTPDMYMRLGMRGKHVVGVPARSSRSRAAKPA